MPPPLTMQIRRIQSHQALELADLLRRHLEEPPRGRRTMVRNELLHQPRLAVSGLCLTEPSTLAISVWSGKA
jgi:hypothetical protein